jgi:hypothetical protein
MVLEADAAALVVDVAVALALRGHPARITHENGPRLVRLGALMLAEFGVGTAESAEESDAG